MFFSRTGARLLRPKLSEIVPKIAPPIQTPLRKAFDRLTAEIDACCQEERLVAKLDSFQLHFLARLSQFKAISSYFDLVFAHKPNSLNKAVPKSVAVKTYPLP